MLPLIGLLQLSLVSSSYVKLPFNRASHRNKWETTDPTKPVLAKRSSDTIVSLKEQRTFYSVDLKLGTPSQQLTMLIDTGSSDMIVLSNENPYCSSDLANTCLQYGTFDSSQSSSFSTNQTTFKIKYGDGTSSTGTWCEDQVQWGNDDDSSRMPISFGLATSADSIGVLGIGLPGLEVTHSSTDSYQYNNFPMQLKQNNIINNVVYSLFLEEDNHSGDVLFGAVDKSKFQSGFLYTLPIINRYAARGATVPNRFEITLQGVGMIDSSDNENTLTTTQLPALLDSGSTLVYLPSELAISVIQQAGATTDGSSGTYSIDCNKKGDDDFGKQTLVFDFGGFHINVPFSKLILDNTNSAGQCIFGVTTEDSNSVILGDSFLTSAYVIFDLEKYEISLGQLEENSSSDDIEEITNGYIPGVKRGVSYFNTWSLDQSPSPGGNIFTTNNQNSNGYQTSTKSSSASTIQKSSSSNTLSTTTNGETSTYTKGTSDTHWILSTSTSTDITPSSSSKSSSFVDVSTSALSKYSSSVIPSTTSISSTSTTVFSSTITYGSNSSSSSENKTFSTEKTKELSSTKSNSKTNGNNSEVEKKSEHSGKTNYEAITESTLASSKQISKNDSPSLEKIQPTIITDENSYSHQTKAGPSIVTNTLHSSESKIYSGTVAYGSLTVSKSSKKGDHTIITSTDKDFNSHNNSSSIDSKHYKKSSRDQAEATRFSSKISSQNRVSNSYISAKSRSVKSNSNNNKHTTAAPNTVKIPITGSSLEVYTERSNTITCIDTGTVTREQSKENLSEGNFRETSMGEVRPSTSTYDKSTLLTSSPQTSVNRQTTDVGTSSASTGSRLRIPRFFSPHWQ